MLGAELFDRHGVEVLFRVLHVVVGIAWIGILYYFNVVQVPAFAKLDPGARNEAIDKIASRALWWFRWAAAATIVMGLLILGVQEPLPDETGFSTDYWGTITGTSILTGILFGATMFLNVWLIIWPAQKVVLANARNVLAGGEPDPNAAAAGRRALLASRTNTFFSFTMIWFMVSTGFVSGLGFGTSDGILAYWIVALIIWALLEAFCTGMIGGTGPNPARQWLETVQGVIIGGVVLWIVWMILWLLLLNP